MSETEDYDKSATPTAHKTSHQDGGTDEISVEGLAGELVDDQPSTWTMVSGKPTSFTPAAHKTSHQDAGSDEISVGGLSGLLGDAQTPLAHKTSHQDTGTDEISVAGLSGLLADDQHVLDAEAVSAMGAKANDNPLNHDRYADSEALAAAVQSGAITDGVTKAPTHDAVYDVKVMTEDHSARHENGGLDEISVGGLSGLLADDQHILDSEVLAYLLSLTGAAANKKLFMNAGGTAPEWASQFKVGVFAHDADVLTTGDTGYTGVGFKPSFIFILSNTGSSLEVSIGFDDATTHNSLVYHPTLTWIIDTTHSITLYQTAAIYMMGIIKSFDADGFTITWTKTGAKVNWFSCIYVAMR